MISILLGVLTRLTLNQGQKSIPKANHCMILCSAVMRVFAGVAGLVAETKNFPVLAQAKLKTKV